MWSPELPKPCCLTTRQVGWKPELTFEQLWIITVTWLCDVFLLCIKKDGGILTFHTPSFSQLNFLFVWGARLTTRETEGFCLHLGRSGSDPGGWLRACLWGMGTDHLWGRKGRLSEGPLRALTFLCPIVSCLVWVLFCWGECMAGYTRPLRGPGLSSVSNIQKEEEESGLEPMTGDQSFVWIHKVIFFCLFLSFLLKYN